MMQNQQQTLQVLMAKMEADEKRRREQEALSAAVSNPFGSASAGTASGSPSAKASAPPPVSTPSLNACWCLAKSQRANSRPLGCGHVEMLMMLLSDLAQERICDMVQNCRAQMTRPIRHTRVSISELA